MFTTIYVTTKDDKGHRHEYRQPPTEAVPSGHDVVNIRKAGEFRLSEIISDVDAIALFRAVNMFRTVEMPRRPKHAKVPDLRALQRPHGFAKGAEVPEWVEQHNRLENRFNYPPGGTR